MSESTGADAARTTTMVGHRLRALRLASGRSLRSVAEVVGISPSALSQIENGVMQPSVNRLIEIVNVLGVPVSAIFEGHDVLELVNLDAEGTTEPIPGVRVIDGVARPVATLGQGVVYRSLSPVRLDGIDLYETIYPPLASSSVDGAMLVHEGYEVGRVVSGELTFEFSEGSVVLGPGGSLSFSAARPHRVVNTSPENAAVAIWMTVRTLSAEVTPPQ